MNSITRYKCYFLLSIIFTISCKKNNENDINTQNIQTFFGPEDILLDENNGNARILASCSARREKYGDGGEIYEIDMATNISKILPRTNEPQMFVLHPHGFDITTINEKTYLYVIAHRPFNDTGNSVVRYLVEKERLIFDKIYINSLIVSPNALAALPNGSFYLSNDGNENILNILLKPNNGSIIYSSEDGEMKTVDNGLNYANGVAVKNGKLFLATVLGKAIYSYDILDNNDLINKKRLVANTGWDNIRWNEDKLIVARHTDISKFLAHYVSEKNYSPFEIASIDTSNGNSKILYQNDGSIISGVSTALLYKNNIYMGQIFEGYVTMFKQ
jgi:hypothetical protein